MAPQIWTTERRQKQSLLMKRLVREGKLNTKKGEQRRANRKCAWCDHEFYHPSERKTCSDQCAQAINDHKWEKYQHPKGMLNKTHSMENKIKQGINSKKMWQDKNSIVNSKKYRQSLSDRNVELHKKGILGGHTAYSSSVKGWWPSEQNKQYFLRSSYEFVYADYLEFLIKAKIIDSWTYEEDTFWFENIKRGVRSYTPDFKVYYTDKNGLSHIEYHEVKGWLDPKSKTKLSRMKKYYQNIHLKLIDGNVIKAIKKGEKPITTEDIPCL